MRLSLLYTILVDLWLHNIILFSGTFLNLSLLFILSIMRHQYKRVLELHTGNQTRSNVIRNFLTSIIKHGQITTTPKRAKVIVSEVNRFFCHLLGMLDRYNESDAKREMIRFLEKTLWTDEEGKKVINEYIVRYKEMPDKTNFVNTYKTTIRKWDAVQNILVRLD